MYILDTNHCSNIINNKEIIRERLLRTDKELLTTCVIVKGELVFMGENSARKEENLRIIYDFLNNLTIFDIDKSVAKIYGELKTKLIQKFAPLEKNKRRNFNIKKIGLYDNDLWIASIALRQQCTVLTQDCDFNKIKEASIELKTESWLPQRSR